ncbi:ABC transporter permease [Cellvibrio sp. KY-GH-1]|uniref:ABC transporter permease n=1 Tax=Cellvibrio sp. KY-GH-1 TaxID=2303332 RepID=UPI001243A5C4|nr:ABC transporter permease [Cellvibrio sp. KY-GH-1]QEY16220.1 ABC transporter permease [Cellvibrio sp. KY-GH-1]
MNHAITSSTSGISRSLQRIGAIVFKELRQLTRDRPTFGMIVMVPLIQLLLFGFAINTNVRDLPVGLVDLSHTQVARQLTADLQATQVVRFSETYQTPQQAEDAIRRGHVHAVLIIPDDFGQRLQDNRSIAHWLIDGSDTMVSNALLALQQMPFSSGFEAQPMQRKNTFEIALFFNPERRSAVNIVPGLVAIVLTMTMVMFTSAALVRERERGNLELLITTPVHSSEIMIGKIVPYIFVGLIQMAIILGLGHLIFDVPINGRIDQLVLGVFAFISASLTLGLLISTIAKTQLQAMQLTVFLLIPSILLSGFMFPYEGMPEAAQWIAETLPATHFIRMVRAIVLRGATLDDLWPDLLWLIGFTILGVFAAAMRFKKRLD